MLTMQGMAGYVFPNFYGSAAAQSTASLLSSVLILLVCAPFASKLASRFGKKELATVSCIVATVLEIICFVLKPANVCRLLLCRLHLPGLLQHHHLGNDHRCHR